jgi:hypothetical protein
MAEYKMVQIPPNLSAQAKGLFASAPDPSQLAAQYLEQQVGHMAQQGWEFYRVDPIGVRTAPGCLAGLFGAKESYSIYYVITFRRG